MPLRIVNLCAVLIWICCNTACHRKEVVITPVITDSTGKINVWVYDSMHRYYYWSSSMPARPDYTLPVADFFSSLLNKEDRYSVISNGDGVTFKGSTFQMYGFHYAFIRHPQLNTLVGVVTYAAPETPAYRVGLRRGSCFIKVNGSTVTEADMSSAEALLESDEPVSLTLASVDSIGWTEGKTLTINSAYIDENSVVQTKYFSYNGKKTGYLLYNSFTEGYDASLMAAFGKLKSAGVEECIIDLRYNPGGSVSSCAKVAGMLAAINGADVFGVFGGNSYEGTIRYTLSQLLGYSSSSSGNTVALLQASRLNLKRVFILTTRATVSAAELLVNNLKPFTQVVQIGDTTQGKDQASFKIYDYRQPQVVKYELNPIVYKLFNANGSGGYSKGIIPSYLSDELSVFPLGELGTADDVLIAQALQLIYGSTLVDVNTLRKRSVPVSVLFHSAGRDAAAMPAVALPGLH